MKDNIIKVRTSRGDVAEMSEMQYKRIYLSPLSQTKTNRSIVSVKSRLLPTVVRNTTRNTARNRAGNQRIRRCPWTIGEARFLGELYVKMLPSDSNERFANSGWNYILDLLRKHFGTVRTKNAVKKKLADMAVYISTPRDVKAMERMHGTQDKK